MLHTTKRTTSPAVRFSYGSHTLYGLYNTISFSHCTVRFCPLRFSQNRVFIRYIPGSEVLHEIFSHTFHTVPKRVVRYDKFLIRYVFLDDTVRFFYDTFFARHDTILIRYESCTLIIRFVGVAVRSRVCKYTLNRTCNCKQT